MSELPIVRKIEGLPGSGKSRFLVRTSLEWARTLQNDPRTENEASKPPSILILAVTQANEKQLKQWVQEQSAQAKMLDPQTISSLPVRVQRWDRWLLSILKPFENRQKEPSNQDEQSGITLLENEEGAALFHSFLRKHLPGDHPLFYAAQQAETSRLLWSSWLRENVASQSDSVGETDFERLGALFNTGLPEDTLKRLTSLFEQARLLHPNQLIERVLQSFTQSSERLLLLRRQFAAVLVDEAQELSTSQHELLKLLELPLALAGNAELSIRGDRGAEPELFASLAPYRTHYQIEHVRLEGLSPSTDWFGIGQHLFPKALEMPVSSTPLETMQHVVNRQTASPEIFQNATPADPTSSRLLPENGQLSLLSDSPEPPVSKSVPTTAQVTQHKAIDASAEAAWLAEDLLRFQSLGKRQSKENPNDEIWSRCAVLLRSGRFREEVIEAFTQRGIPIQEHSDPDDLDELPAGLFDILSLLNGLYTDQLFPAENNASEESIESCETWEKRLALALHIGEEDGLPPQWRSAYNRCQEWLAASGESPTKRLFSLCQAWEQGTGWLDCWPQLVSCWLAAHPEWENDSIYEALLANFEESLSRLNSLNERLFNTVLRVDSLLAFFMPLWEMSSRRFLRSRARSDHGVHILRVHQAQGMFFDWVALPFLVEGEFPQQSRSLLLGGQSATIEERLQSQAREQQQAEERLFVEGLTRSTQRLVVSTHSFATDALLGDRLEKEALPVLPSVFYSRLTSFLKAREDNRSVISAPSFALSQLSMIAELPKPALLPLQLEQPLKADSDSSPETRMTETRSPYVGGTALWGKIPVQTATPILAPHSEQSPDKHFTLSATAIKAYMVCPRQFYYAYVLRLPSPSSPASTAGVLTHRLFECFNKTAIPGQYTATRFLDLMHTFLMADATSEAYQQAGLTEQDAITLNSLDSLHQIAFKARIEASADNLIRLGYFERYANCKRILAEVSLPAGFSLPALTPEAMPSCFLKGKADALFQHTDGRWEIVDYKSYGNTAFSRTPDTCQQRFTESVLASLDGDVDHVLRFESRLDRVIPADYQLPLYYLAFNQDERFRGQLSGTTLQLFRPDLNGKQEQGSMRLSVTGDEIETAAGQIVSDIREHIVRPMLTAETFEPIPTACGTCAYRYICDAAASDEDGDELSEGLE